MLFLPIFEGLKIAKESQILILCLQNVCTVFVVTLKVKNIKRKYTHMQFGMVE